MATRNREGHLKTNSVHSYLGALDVGDLSQIEGNPVIVFRLEEHI